MSILDHTGVILDHRAFLLSHRAFLDNTQHWFCGTCLNTTNKFTMEPPTVNSQVLLYVGNLNHTIWPRAYTVSVILAVIITKLNKVSKRLTAINIYFMIFVSHINMAICDTIIYLKNLPILYHWNDCAINLCI